MEDKMAEIKTRNCLFDNIKAVMLVLVVAGHTLDPFITNQDSLFRYIMQYIYLFHMPMFAFVTGYFSKNADAVREKAVKSVLIPYILLQCAYIVTAEVFIFIGAVSYNVNVFKPSLLLPTSPLYYLLCVFFWKVFWKDINKLRYPEIFAVISGLLISLIQNREFHIGIGATFSLMIFFVLGAKCTEQHVQRIRQLPKYIGVIIMGLGIIPAIVLPYSFRNVRFTYESVGLSNLAGIGYRILFYFIATCMIIAIINLMPQGKSKLSQIGENSIIVYVGSSICAPSLYLVLAKVLPVTANMWTNLLGIAIFSVFVAWFFSKMWIKKIYDWVLSKIYFCLYKV